MTELPKYHFCLVLCFVVICSLTGTSGQNNDCPPDTFDPPLCNGTCHCKNGPSQCDPVSGLCEDYQCSWGWGSPPYCQDPCPELRFGVNCELTCHCPINDTCDPQDGLCRSGRCDAAWGGPSCQTRKIQFTAEPKAINVTCRNFTITFRAWSEDLDFGEPPIHGYELQYRINQSDWARYAYYVNDGRATYRHEFTFMDEYNTYEFRVIANANDEGYPKPGVPGPESDLVEPRCIMPTQKPTADQTTEPASQTAGTTSPAPTTLSSTVPTTSSSSTIKSTEESTVPSTTPSTTTTVSTTPMEETTEELTTPTTVTTSTTVTTPATTVTTTTPTSTSTVLDTPGPVRNLSAILERSSGEVLLTWLPPVSGDSEVTQYIIRYWKAGVGNCVDLVIPGPVFTQFVNSRITSKRLGTSESELEDFTKYRITVVADSDVGEGETSAVEVVTQDIVPTGVITGIRLDEVFSRQAVINWDELPCLERGGPRVRYDINFIRDSGEVLEMSTASTPPYQATRLTPYTRYRVQVRYTNRAGGGQWSNPDQLVFRTLAGTPTAPTNVRVTDVEDTRLLVNWTAPFPSHGPIKAYQIIYWVDRNQQLTQAVQLSNTALTGKWISDLRPFTSYDLQVQAQTEGPNGEGYWGELSETISQTTGDGTPSRPIYFGRTSRNETCITLTWEAPVVPNGVIQGYQLSYRIIASSTASDQDPGMVVRDINSPVNFYVVCNLLPSVQYLFGLVARNRAFDSEQSVYDSWTVVANPRKPDRPVVITRETTTTDITIEIEPVILLSGPVTGYYIVVYKPPVTNNGVNSVITRQKRQVQNIYRDPTVHIPLPGNTVAFIPHGSLLETSWFTVGDNLTWGTYKNPPLEPDTRYDIYFVVMSYLDGITKMAYSETELPARTRSLVGEDSSNNDRIWIILGSILGVLLLLFLLILLIICCYRRCCNNNNQSDKENLDVKKDTWLEYYTSNFYNTLGGTKNSKKWSDITEFSEARHVTINDSYNPLDLQVSEIQGGKHLISFEEEYKHLPVGVLAQYSTRVAQRPENQDKNRFDHLLAYDHSRVILKGKKGSGYINASYINGYQKRSAYIAAQSPFTEETINDFWFMIFQEKITHIVFLVRLKEDGIVKSEKYWPDGENTIKCGDIFVQHVATDNFANFVVRIFDIHKGRITRRVFQYHFTAWPNHGTPDDPIPFLEFQMKVSGSVKVTNDTGPLLIHCGTGVSRTAVYIALDSLLEQAKVENCVNVYKFVRSMRQNRTMMMRTLKQYIFLYDILFEALVTNYHIVGDDLKVNYRLLSNKNPATDKSLFREQFDILEKFIPELIPEKCQDALRDVNLKKNRFETIVPPDNYRPPLMTPGGRDRTDYINALLIDGYLQARNFIVTQTPLPNTVIDFWKLVWDYRVSAIVMLNGSDFKEDTCATYWPARKGQEKYEPFFVNLTHTSEKEHVIIRTFKVTSGLRPSETPREVKQFQFESWRMYEKVPWSREGFIQLTELVEDWLVDSETMGSPILVHCMDGAGQSGLFCAASLLFEKMREENVVDVFHTVKHLKRRRPHFINTLEQYKFCFKILWDYMNTRMEKPIPPANGVAFHNDGYFDSYA